MPAELQERFGKPEHVFGPNLRVRIIGAFCAVIFVIMGVTVFLLGLAGVPLGASVSRLLAVPLVVLGAVVLVGTRLVPLNWVFVYPRGLVRTRGDAWDCLDWTEVERFEDATLTHKAVTMRQCRIVLKERAEWGFLADYIAEYGRLTDVLSRKVDDVHRASDLRRVSG